jgi:hypothetical protein
MTWGTNYTLEIELGSLMRPKIRPGVCEGEKYVPSMYRAAGGGAEKAREQVPDLAQIF